MAKYYDLLKQLIEGQINRTQYDKLVSDRDKAEAAKSLPSDAKLFKLAEQQEAKQKAESVKEADVGVTQEERDKFGTKKTMTGMQTQITARATG